MKSDLICIILLINGLKLNFLNLFEKKRNRFLNYDKHFIVQKCIYSRKKYCFHSIRFRIAT